MLCKGHAAPIQYAALAQHGYFPLEDLMGLRQIGAQLQGHPDMNRTPGVEVSTGSLGQGLSMCVGIALALRLDGLDETAQVFGVLSDGDCQEGQTWEAATAAAHFGVPNLTAIVDYNHLQTDGTTEEVMDIGDVRAKFEAFGWDAVEIDGHDMDAVVEALERSRTLRPAGGDRLPDEQGPAASRSMEGRFGFHGKPPSARAGRPRRWRSSRRRLEEQTKALQAARDERLMPAEAKTEPTATRSGLRRRARRPRRGARGRRRARRRPGRSPPRRSSSASSFPERFFNVGAAEANMMSMACGLAATGKVPYCSTFAIFATGPRLRPGPARHRPQRAEGADRRLARRRLARARTAPRTR